MIHEIRCDAVYEGMAGNRVRCTRTFQTAGAPVEVEAEGNGWVTGDLTLCPTHVAEGADRILAEIDRLGATA